MCIVYIQNLKKKKYFIPESLNTFIYFIFWEQNNIYELQKPHTQIKKVILY